jgi:hypothetical protein
LAFSSLDNREPEKVPGTIKKSQGARKKSGVRTKNVRGRGAAFIKICQNTPQLCWGDEWPPLSPQETVSQ